VIDTSGTETQPLVLAEQVAEHQGQGLDGMRRRLESVGGKLDVRRRAEAGGPTFTATAWVPVRSR
jgi:signal transduction histidine kinase